MKIYVSIAGLLCIGVMIYACIMGYAVIPSVLGIAVGLMAHVIFNE